MKRMLVLVALILATSAFYIAGSATGVLALVGIGVLLEFCFWFGIIQKRRGKKQFA